MSATDIESLKCLVPLAVPAIKTTVENWLAPAIAKISKSKELIKNSKPELVEKAFEEYLLRAYGKLSFMNTIVFGNQQKRVQDLYIPLTVRSTCPQNQKFPIRGWREDFVPAFKRVVITDTAGMGKSTILKWLFLCSLGTSKCIPIFIELRTLASGKKILDKIYEDLCPIDKPFDKDLLLHLIKEGNFIFFLDGFDEVAFEDRRSVTEDVQSFIGKAIHNLFILASRHESALGSFGEFREFTIQPLSKEEAYNLLRRYDDTQEHSEALIAELEESKYEQLKDLMINPMLVSLLYKAYSSKPKVPFKKHIFDRQVFDALFDMHDSTKGGAFIRKKNSNLDIDEFHSIMRDIGFTTAKLGKIEYDKDGILDIIKKVRERNPSILFQPAALLTDLVTTVPLFNKEGEHYKWAHKSVQDYFASQFIAVDAKGNECAILEKIYDGGHCRRFENILDLLHDTDNKSFRRVLLHKLLKDYVDHYDNKYNSPFPGVSLESITRRKQLTFGGNTAIGLISFEEFDEIIKSPSSIAKKFKHLSPKAINSDSLTFFQFSKKCFILLFNPSPAAGLLPLLAAKKYSYIAKASESYDYDEKALANFNCDTGFVSDDPDSPMNAPDCFDVVNHLLENHGFLITIEQARRTLRSIEEESNDSDQVNQMLQNL